MPKKIESKVEEKKVVEKKETVKKAAPKKKKATVAVSKLNFREGPDKTAKVIKVLSHGENVSIIDELDKSEFVKVETADKLGGYCMKRFLSL